MAEKAPNSAAESLPTFLDDRFDPSSSTSVWQSLTAPIYRSYHVLDSWRTSLGLYQPGTTENLTKEIKTTHFNNFFTDGARADITRALSFNPAFQVTHALTLGGMQQAGPMGSVQNPGNYQLGVLFATNETFAQASMDHELSMMGRLNHAWSLGTSKAQVHLAQNPSAPSMVQLEHDYLGKDFSASFKALNPSLADGTGVYVGSYLQSVGPKLALGLETIWQRPEAGVEDAGTSYMVKYVGGQKDRPWIATSQLQIAQGVLQSTYWQKLGERVEAGVDYTLNLATRKGAATLGAKYDFRTATLRAQLDSMGKVGMLAEQRFTQAFAFTVGGEIDHYKNTSKWGIGISLESSTPEVEAQATTTGGTQLQPPM